MDKQVKISVRRLVEHVYLSGSIDIGISLPSNFSEGTKIHQAIQKTFSETSQKEVYVQTEIKYDDLLFVIDGRIDGLHHFEETVIVEEIKSTAMDFHELNADTYPVHWAQAFCMDIFMQKIMAWTK